MNRCSGIKAQLNRGGTRGERLIDPLVNGKVLEPQKVYTVATSGGRTQLVDDNHIATESSAVNELIKYIESATPIVANQPVQSYQEPA